MYVIKQFPEDFVVDEVPEDFEFKDSGAFTYCIVKKRNYSTIDVAKRLAEFFSISLKDVGFAGNKDKAALTSQYFSLKNISESHLSKFKNGDIKVIFGGFSDKPISLGMLKGNNFSITIRNISSIPEKPSIFINYFGIQRFGKNNINLGRFLVLKKFD